MGVEFAGELYERFGFQILERVDIPLPNGMTLGCARMQKQIHR